MSDDSIPLAGDEPEPVYNRPEKVSSKYTEFETKYGDPAKLAALDDTALLTCAREALSVKDYIYDKFGTPLAEIEKASQFAVDAKQKLDKALNYSTENFPGPKTSPMQYVIMQLQARASGANAAQLRGVAKAILEELAQKLEAADKAFNPPAGANDLEKKLKLSVVAGLIDEFVKSNAAAIEACTADTFLKIGYKNEPGLDRVKECTGRAAVFDKLCKQSKNSYGWHKQEMAFLIKKIAEVIKSRESVMAELDHPTKVALGLVTESKIRHAFGISNKSGWTVGPPTGIKGPPKDDGQGPIGLADEKGSR